MPTWNSNKTTIYLSAAAKSLGMYMFIFLTGWQGTLRLCLEHRNFIVICVANRSYDTHTLSDGA